MDETDRTLLDVLQDEIPLVGRPFVEAGARIGLSEAEVLRRVRALNESGLLRRVGPSFVAGKLGYVSTLAAARVRADRIEGAAEVINGFEEVTHNYEREGEFNVWFTVTARDGAGIERVLERVRGEEGVEELIDLPAMRVFKTRVRFRMQVPSSGFRVPSSSPRSGSGLRRLDAALKLTERDRALVCALQEGLPLVEQPYAEVAHRAGWTEADALARLREWRESGVLRRVCAYIRHRDAGFTANGLMVCDVRVEQVEAAGARLAGSEKVTHCYARRRTDRFPFRLYAMVHGRTREEVEAEAGRLAEAGGIERYQVLFSVRELKRGTMRFFCEKE